MPLKYEKYKVKIPKALARGGKGQSGYVGYGVADKGYAEFLLMPLGWFAQRANQPKGIKTKKGDNLNVTHSSCRHLLYHKMNLTLPVNEAYPQTFLPAGMLLIFRNR